ncbi:GH32 C-terminal domain-containing protein, partial [Zongyangia hominis]
MKRSNRALKKGKRCLALVFALVVALTSILPAGVFSVSAATEAMGLEGLSGPTLSETSAGVYEMAYKGGNSFALSKTQAKAFTLEADVTFLQGNTATMMFGAGTSDATNVGNGTDNAFFGLEFTRDVSAKTVVIKLFEDGPSGQVLGNNIIPGKTYMAKDVDTEGVVHLKLVVTPEKTLEIYVAGQEVTYTFAKDFAKYYKGGYIGLMTYNSSIRYENISFTKNDVYQDLTNLNGPQLTKLSDNNYQFAFKSGNSFSLSETKAFAFTLETDVTYVQGNTATILFGSMTTDPANVGRGTTNSVFGLEFSRNVGEKAIYIKLFENGPDGVLGDGIIAKMKAATVEDTDTVHLKIEVTESKDLNIAINDTAVSYTFAKDFKSAYEGGYIGLMAYSSQLLYSNVDVTVNSLPPVGNFNNNLSGWRTVSGKWTLTDSGMKASNLTVGNSFYMSSTQLAAGEAFVYEGDMHLPNETGARGGGLVFGVTNIDKPGDAWYCMNVDRNQNVTKLFKNVSGSQGFTIQRQLTAQEKTKEDFHFRVELLEGGKMNYYLDGGLVGSNSDPSFAGGYFGIMSYFSNCSFDNVKYYKVSTPKLTGLKVEGADITPSFSDSVYEYTAEVPFEIATLQVTPAADAKFSLSVNDEAAVSGKASPVELKVGYNTIYVKVMDDASQVSNIITLKVKRAQDPENAFTDDYRPQFHFTPEFNFMNDPNGLVYDPSNQTWHMFFQHSPQLPNMGNQTWGHAQSKDLVNWTQLPTAMEMDELGRIYSGSAVVDEKNTSGFFTDNKEGESKLVAVFTHSGGAVAGKYGGQKQSIAYSKDHGLTWTKYEGNPVIPNEDNKYGGGFRDPKVLWYPDASYKNDGIWLMIVAGGRARIFSSENLREWKHESDLNYADGTALESECPDLFELPIDGDKNNTKWVYFGAGKFFVLGELVKEGTGADAVFKFNAETNRINISNNVTEMYATQSYYNDGAGLGRRISVSWMRDSTAPGTIPDKVWNGAQSLPLETSLRTVNGQVKLCFYPVEEINSLRAASPMFAIDKPTVVSDGDANILSGLAGQKYDIEAKFTLGSASEFGFNLRTGDGQKTVVKYNQDRKELIVDKTKSGVALNALKSWEMVPEDDGTVTLRILVDWSVLDVFGNDGDSSISTLFFPDGSSIGMEFFATGGDVTIDSMKIYDMKSMYRDDLPTPDSDPTMLSLTAPANADVGEEFTVTASVLPYTVNDKSVTWTYDTEKLVKVDETDNSITLKAAQAGDYVVKAVTNKGGLEKEATVSVIKRNFNTNLTGWTTTEGVWTIDENGWQAVCGSDNFAMSDVSMDGNFTLEADVTLEAGRCLGLVFHSQGANGKTAGSYVFNFDRNMNNFRIFEFPYINGATSDLAKISFTDAGITPEIGETYHVVLTVKDNKFSVSFDGKELFKDVADTNDTQVYDSGRLGLIVHQSTARFQNVFVKSESPIKTVVTQIEDINVMVGAPADEVLAKLPAKVTVEQEDGIQRDVDVVW